MIDRLDQALRLLLDDPALQQAFPELFDAEVSFATPERGHAPSTDAEINLFLFDTFENRELRDPVPQELRLSGTVVRRRAPLRVDCLYRVTAWARQPNGAANDVAQHQLLGQALNWLSRFAVIPDDIVQRSGLATQGIPPPTLVAQMDRERRAGEFWTALGIAPRPSFDLVATISMDLDQVQTDGLVTTLSVRPRAGESPGMVLNLIGGTVRDGGRNPVRDAWVLLEPEGRVSITDAQGRFVFERVVPRPNLALRARAPGLGETPATPIVVPSPSGNYDLQF